MRLLGALLLILLAVNPVASQQPQKPEPDQKKLTAPYRGTEEAPFIVKTVPEQQSPDEIIAKKEKAELDRKTVNLTGQLADHTWFLFLATGFLGIATLCLAGVALWQLIEARDSIDAAKRAADTAERALTVVERAFVALANMTVSTLVFGNPNDQTQITVAGFIIHVNVINSGRTPALKYISNINVVFIDKIPEDFRFPDRNAKTPTERSVLGPQTQMFLLAEIAIQEVMGVFNKEKVAVVYGWIEYDDIFPDSERHRTEFCFMIQTPFGDPRIPLRTEGPRPPPQLSFTVHGNYNATDKDCRYKPGETPVAEPGELPEIIQPPPNPFPQARVI